MNPEELYEIYDPNKEYKRRTLARGLRDRTPSSVYLDAGGFDLEDIMPITENLEINGKSAKYSEEIFNFRNGTTEERALAFLEKGEGFTRLESHGGFYLPDKDYISNFGLQIHEQKYQANKDWFQRDSINYAKNASYNYGGRPVVIEGSIPSKYVYQQKNEHEFAIPKDYHDKITDVTIKDAETGEVLHTFKNDANNNIQQDYLTAQEAFNKYGPDDERFYTSQGLDPNQQREAIDSLNAGREPVKPNEEIIEQLQKEQEEIAENFYQSQKEANQIIDKYHKLDEQLAEKTIKETENIEQKVISETEETITKEAVEQEEKLITKEIGESAKKSLNTKKLGIGLAIAGGALLLGGLSHKKKQNKQEKENNKPKPYRQGYGSMSYNQDLAYANGITNFSTGHSTYSL